MMNNESSDTSKLGFDSSKKPNEKVLGYYFLVHVWRMIILVVWIYHGLMLDGITPNNGLFTWNPAGRF